MSNFASLKATIQQYIKQNGNEEITGAVLQDILLSVVSVLGDTAINDLESALQTETTNRQNADGTLQDNINAEATARGNADTALGNRLTTVEDAVDTINTKLAEGYVYAGMATPSTNPGSPAGKVFYIAVEGGTYTNFSGLTVANGITILKYSSGWTKEQMWAVEDYPTAGSHLLVESGGVDKAILGVEDKIKEIEPLVPLEVVDGKYYISYGAEGTTGHAVDNPDWLYMKFEVQPNKTYLFSGILPAGVNIWYGYVFDEDNLAVQWFGNYNYADGVVFRNDNFSTVSSAKFVYINMHKEDAMAAEVCQYKEETSVQMANMLSLKSYGLYVDNSWMHYFFDERGLVANNGMAVVRFRVNGNTQYKFSHTYPAGITATMIVYADYVGNFLSYSGTAGSASEEVSYNNYIITTPANCQYVYMNIYINNLASAKFEIANLVGDKLPINPLLVKMTPSSISDNKFTYDPTNEHSNDSFQIWKYVISPHSFYYINEMYSYANIGFAYYTNENGDNLGSVSLSGAAYKLVKADSYFFEAKDNATRLWLNHSKTYANDSCGLFTYSTDDRTWEIRTRLAQKGHCKLGAGVYFINGLDMPEYSHLEGCGNSTVVVLSGTSDGYAIRLRKFCKISNIRFLGAVEDISITTPSGVDSIEIGNRHGILYLGNGDNTELEGCQINGCEFRNFSGGAITLQYTGYATHRGLSVSNCRMTNCGAGVNVAYWSEFNRFTNIGVEHCQYGLINNGGNNNFVNCDFSNNGIGVYMNSGTDKCLLYNGTTATAINDAHGLMCGCTVNHSGGNTGYAVVMIDTVGGFVFDGMELHYGIIRLVNSRDVMMSNMKFGNDVTVEGDSTKLIVISNATFNYRFAMHIYTDTAMTTLDTNYLTDGNLQKVKLINSYADSGSLVSVQTFNQE